MKEFSLLDDNTPTPAEWEKTSVCCCTRSNGTQGPVGPQGPQGPAGVAGQDGETGPKGDKGDKGDKGVDGNTGVTGATGEQGPIGLTGATGPQGPQGIPGGNNNIIHAHMQGVLTNDANTPLVVVSGSPVRWKVITKNESGVLKPAADQSYFQFTQTGRYLMTASIRVFSAVPNTMFNYGLYAQSIQQEMVTTASATLDSNIREVSCVGIFDVPDVNEKYNIINNGLKAVSVQGCTSTQTVITKFVNVNGVNVVDGFACSFIKLKD